MCKQHEACAKVFVEVEGVEREYAVCIKSYDCKSKADRYTWGELERKIVKDIECPGGAVTGPPPAARKEVESMACCAPGLSDSEECQPNPI